MQYFNRIKIELEKQGKSQVWLAKQIGITTNTISSFCRNESQPKLDDLYRIAKTLEIDVIKLLVPNDYSKRIERLMVPTGESHAKMLNAFIKGMFNKDKGSKTGYFYYDNRREYLPSDIASEEMFNALRDVLIQDDIIVSNEGGLQFTGHGLFLMYDFRDNIQESTEHIGYEARWREVMHFSLFG